MNRQEWKDWATSLKPGDKVIVSKWNVVALDYVKKVTPKGWVVTEKSGTYCQTEYCDRYLKRGGGDEIVPWSMELEQQAIVHEKALELERLRNRTISMAKSIAYDWAYSKKHVSYELAQKIIELDKQMEE